MACAPPAPTLAQAGGVARNWHRAWASRAPSNPQPWGGAGADSCCLGRVDVSKSPASPPPPPLVAYMRMPETHVRIALPLAAIALTYFVAQVQLVMADPVAIGMTAWNAGSAEQVVQVKFTTSDEVGPAPTNSTAVRQPLAGSKQALTAVTCLLHAGHAAKSRRTGSAAMGMAGTPGVLRT